MYVRTLPFGRSGCSGCGTRGLGGFGTAATDVAAALASCAASMISDARAVGDCVWNALRSYIMSRPDSQILLQAVRSMDCAAALSAIGISGSTASSICSAVSLATGGTAWPYVRQQADVMLNEIAGQATQEMYDRGQDRSEAEGGGHTLVDESGRVVGVICPQYFVEIKDDTGNVIGHGMRAESRVAPGARCPTAAPAVSREMRPLIEEAMRLPPGVITGTVVSSDGRPVAGASIRVGSMSNRPTTTTSSTGSFTVSTTPVTNTRIFVSAPGYTDKMVEHIPLVSGGTFDTGGIQMVAVGTEDDEDKHEGGGEEAAWYSSPWVWIGGLVLAGVGYGVYRYSR